MTGVCVAGLLALPGNSALAGQPPLSAFQAYVAANAASIVAGPTALYSVAVDSIAPTQMNEGFTEVGKKIAGFDLLAASQLQSTLLSDIEPVVIGPGGKLYLTDGHHTFTALEESIYGASNPTVYVNVIANYSNLTTAQFFAMMQQKNFLLPLADGVAETVNDATGSPIPASLTGLTNDPYRALEYGILKNKSSKLFPTASNITGAVGVATPGLDKMTGLYSDFLEAAAYRGADNGLGLPYLSPGDIAAAAKWNLTPTSTTTLPNISGTVTAAQLPGFILGQNIVNSGGISNATLASGAMDGYGTFTGITKINAGTPSAPITIGTANTGFIMQLGNDAGYSVTLNGTNTYTGGTSILAGDLIVGSDAALGAATPSGWTLNTANIAASVQAGNGIIFNSLSEGNGTLTIGTTAGGGTATAATARPIAVDGETATLNVNGYIFTLNGQLVSLGTAGVGIGNATGISDLTIDDNSASLGKLVLATPSPYFYGNIIIGNTNKPTVEVMSDAALGNTAGPSGPIGGVVLNGGTFQAGASFSSVRSVLVSSKSTFDTNGFTTSFAGLLSDSQRNLTITNSGSGVGAVSFNAFDIGSALELTVSKGTGTSTSVAFNNGISQTSASDQLLLKPNSGTFGTAETVFSSGASTQLSGGSSGIVAPWIVIDSGASSNPYTFATYGTASGYTAFSGYATSIASATASSIVRQSSNATLTGNAQAYALNLQKGDAITVGSGHTLTLGNGTYAGLIMQGSSAALNGGALAFGTAVADITVSGSNTISSAISGSGGLNLDGTGTLTLSTASSETGLVTVNSGTLALTAANVFAADSQGLLLQNTKNLATANLTIAASNQFAALNSAGTNSTITLTGGSILTIGDGTNQSSTLPSTITDTTAMAGAITKNGTGLLDLSAAKVTLAAGSSIAVNGGDLRVATGALTNTATAGSAPNFTLASGTELQFAQNGGGQYAGAISGGGVLHLIGGTLQLTGTTNSYSGGTIVETGSTLDLTTANVSSGNANITDAGGLVVFDQAGTGSYTGIISDGVEMETGTTPLSGSLIKDDSTGGNGGNLILSQAQAYSGKTYVEAGTLTLNATDALAASSGVDLGRVGGGATATLALGANNTIQQLTSETGNTTSVALNGNTLTINTPSSVAASFAGSLTGTGALVKGGAGTQSFTGTVTPSWIAVNAGLLDIASGSAVTTGATTVGGGELEIDSGASYAASSLTIGATGNLEATSGSALSIGALGNAGTLNIQSGSDTNVLTVASYSGGAGSQLQLGVNLASGTADRLVAANVSGSSQIVLNATGTIGYNPNGIVLVSSPNAMNPLSFTLAGGPVQQGLFQYDVAYDPDPEFVLIGVPSAEAFRLATEPAAVQEIFRDTAEVLTDHQSELRDALSAGTAVLRPDAGMAGNPAAPSPLFWGTGFGDWASRGETRSFADFNKTYRYDTGYTQATGGMFGGIDGLVEDAMAKGDRLSLGVDGGYVKSTQDFRSSATSATLGGGSLGLSGSYLNHGFVADALLKADWLNLTYTAPALAAYGASTGKADAQNYGAIIDGGYRFETARLIAGPAFVEPLATLAYVSTHVGGMAIGGAEAGFGSGDMLRSRLGARAGAELADDGTIKVTGSLSAGYWGFLSGSTHATINSGNGSPLLTITDQPVRNYGDLGFNLDMLHDKGDWSAFVKGGLQFAAGYHAGEVNAGLKFNF